MEVSLHGPQIKLWNITLSNEWEYLAQGNSRCVKYIDTIDLIKPPHVPTGFICDHRLLNAEEWRVSLVVGGDKFPYHEDT